MIFYLRGVVSELTPTYAVMDVGGVGYYVGISVQTSQKLHLGKESTIYTQQIIREDAHLLFGFFDKEEREMFNLLISVNGVGAVSAMILLSSLELLDIAQAILSGNSGILQKVKGIGAKTAERIIIDLKDKVGSFDESELDGPVDDKIFVNDDTRSEAKIALISLGYSQQEAENAISKIKGENLTIEDYIKLALKQM